MSDRHIVHTGGVNDELAEWCLINVSGSPPTFNKKMGQRRVMRQADWLYKNGKPYIRVGKMPGKKYMKLTPHLFKKYECAVI